MNLQTSCGSQARSGSSSCASARLFCAGFARDSSQRRCGEADDQLHTRRADGPGRNTGVFAIGMLTVFKPVLQDYAGRHEHCLFSVRRVHRRELPRGIRCQCGYERRDRTHRAGRAEAAGKINSTPSEWQSAARRGISLYPQNSNRRFKLPALVIKKAPCHALHDKGRRYGNYRTTSASSFLPRRRSMVFFTARKMFW